MFRTRKYLKMDLAQMTTLLSEANERAENRLQELLTLKNQNAGLKSQNEKYIESNKKHKDEKEKLAKLVRKQTDADILLNALEAVGIIKDESPKQPDRTQEHTRLMHQRNHAAQMMSGMQSYGFGGPSIFDQVFGTGR